MSTPATSLRPEASTRSRLWRSIRENREASWGLLFALPVLVLFTLLRIVPAIIAVYLSFTKYNMIASPTWIGLANYAALFKDDVFLAALKNSLSYTFFTVVLGTAAALGIALMLDQKIRGVALFRTAFYTPVVASFVTVSMIWIYMYNPQFGLINYLLSLVGLPKVGWLHSPDWAMVGVIIVGVWKNLGYNVLVLLAGLQAIPQHLYEAAVVDGLNARKRFWRITFPLLSPSTMFVVLMGTIFGLQAFDQIQVLTDGGPMDSTTTIVHYAYRNAIDYLKMGYASAMAVLLFVGILLIVWMLLRFSRTSINGK